MTDPAPQRPAAPEGALADSLSRLRGALLDEAGLVRAVASGRRRGEQPSWRRVELRYVDLQAGRRLQVTSYDDAQAFTGNHDDAAEKVDLLLAEPFGSWYVETTTAVHQLRVTKKGRPLLHTQSRDRAVEPDRVHDRTKQRLLPPETPALRRLGIADADGRIRPSRQAKYRQVEELLRALSATLDDARTAGVLRVPTPQDPLRVADLGCGNAYLTFGVRAWLERTGTPTRLVGVDVKEQSRRHNAELARDLGWADVEFITGEIGQVDLDPPPEVVLALHACDTATDDALAAAVRWQAPVVLAAPCCHHDLAAQLRSATPPFGHESLLRDGILRERLADTLTDGLRATILRLVGYRVEVVEFVESEHTPRNTLIRAIRTARTEASLGRPAESYARQYSGLISTWQVQPRLGVLLADLLPEPGVVGLPR